LKRPFYVDVAARDQKKTRYIKRSAPRGPTGKGHNPKLKGLKWFQNVRSTRKRLNRHLFVSGGGRTRKAPRLRNNR